MSIFPWDTRGNRQHCGESHAYSRKYSRFVRLRLLGFKTPYFRNVNSKRILNPFLSLHYRLHCERMNGNHILLIEDQQGNQRKRQVLRPAFSLAPPAGLEPATSAFNSHAYSRKHSRRVRLDTLGFKAPCFRNLPSKNNIQLFFSVVYRLS